MRAILVTALAAVTLGITTNGKLYIDLLRSTALVVDVSGYVVAMY